MTYSAGEVIEVIPRKIMMKVAVVDNDRILCVPLRQGKPEWFDLHEVRKSDNRPMLIFF